ncbi:carotenoid ester lipase precursor [Dentipellis sp. KUC8613]|nr:carotenoid ester lipase precursor [Dentipellis sp. KUC8613]
MEPIPMVSPVSFEEPEHLAAPPPTIVLDEGTFEGKTAGKTVQFLGIPFAKPPIGDLRLSRPVKFPPYKGKYYATDFGYSCPQQAMTLPSRAGGNQELKDAVNKIVNGIYGMMTPENEDCLTINVIKPATAKPDAKLPVIVWIFGGGFEMGGTSTYGLTAQALVERSIDLKQPAIYVSMNYRLSALGWLASKEIKDAKAGNLGLWDQQLALKWIQEYIGKFGGDPTKVTIWGESAGAISVAMHMLANDGDPQGLFRGAIMQSGGPIPVAGMENGQVYYDNLVQDLGCGCAADTLECLRQVPFTSFKVAMNKAPNFFSYQGLVLAYLPRVDGDFIKEPPLQLVRKGKVARVPMITGNCDDEGSLFSIASINLSTTADTKQFLKSYMLPNASDYEIDLMLKYYPDDPVLGCPFDTDVRNMLSYQFKRIAAIQGDVVFHGPRKFLLKYSADKQPSWSFLSKRGKDMAYLGSAHATDLLNSYGPTGELKDYIIGFASNLDPNKGSGGHLKWPQYDIKDPKAVIFQDSALSPIKIERDDYRQRALEFVGNISLLHPL